jgi:hypothetical protein
MTANLQLHLDGLELSKVDTSSTFAKSMGQAVHRWFRYSAGFSSVWVEETIAAHATRRNLETVRVLDPFVGSGTTLLAAQAVACESRGVESHPFVAEIARAKLCWSADPHEFDLRISEVLKKTKPLAPKGEVPPLLTKCYSEESLAWLRGLLATSERLRDGSRIDQLVWLAFVSIIRRTSFAGTAQWQYVLPNQRKARVIDPIVAYRAQAAVMSDDMKTLQRDSFSTPAELLEIDARLGPLAPKGWADLVVTSPPYANNYDYADAARLEMTVLGQVEGWSDLAAIRDNLVHSCSQHMTRYDLEEALASPGLDPIRSELSEVVRELTRVKATKGGRKAYDLMVAAYFKDLAAVWGQLRHSCADDARVCFVVGNSAPYGVLVPVERWLGELALSKGFSSFTFEKTRDRNVKWENRKHRVPLQEGRLWVES